MASIGYLGLGPMGRGMVANLLKAGHDVTVWNRSPVDTADLAGAVMAESRWLPNGRVSRWKRRSIPGAVERPQPPETRTAVNNDPHIVHGILGVAGPITGPTWWLFGVDGIIRGVVARSFSALLFADDRR